MKKTKKLFPLLSCLLFACSITHADIPAKKQFDFLTHYKNTSLVESGLELLVERTAALSISTLVSFGVWYGVCKTPELISRLSQGFMLDRNQNKELETTKTDFCLQLAPVITAAEVALAGHVSPWPLEQIWWQPQRLAGAGLVAFSEYKFSRNKPDIPIATLTYFVAEATARTVGGAATSQALRKTGITSINPEYYAYGEYVTLSYANALLVGAIAYETFALQGHSPAKAVFAFAVSALMTAAVSAIISISTLDLDDQLIAVTEAAVTVAVTAITAAAAVTVAAAVTGAGAGAGAIARAVTVTAGVAGAATAGVAAVAAGAGAGAGAAAGAIAIAGAAAIAGATTGAAAIAGATAIAAVMITSASSKIASNNPLIKAGVTVPPALILALINGLSNYAVYGSPLEESFLDTALTLPKKFYAPLSYLSTLFN